MDILDYEDIQEEEGVEEDVSTLAKGELVPQVDIDNRRMISKGRQEKGFNVWYFLQLLLECYSVSLPMNTTSSHILETYLFS